MQEKGKWKKVLKTIGEVILGLFLLCFVAVVVIFTVDKVKEKGEWKKLDEAGYVNRVSVGSHKLNVCIRGNEKADFTIVSIAGLNNMANVVEMEMVTDQLTDKYRFAFVDRSGYGLSEDTHEEQTVEQIISDYRTALKKAEINAPYVLMAHSLGGVYASYWQAKYPDEIKAVIYLDPTQIGSIDDAELKNRHADFGMYLNVICSKIGIDRIIFDPKEYTVNLQTQEQKDYATMIWRRCPMSWAVCSEEDNYYDNIKKTYDLIEPNDIPKLYIDASAYTVEDIREKIAYTKQIEKEAGKDNSEVAISEDKIDERVVKASEEFFDTNIQPYMDKLGTVTYVNIPGDHSIFKHKPDEVEKAIADFLGKLK
ncbi:MAG: alpha/beta hydrolase [Lachnospiraceae bacterium]|nr:alpha/beta hydrolase [Lachnospiraceae bacterium]